ncbi:MAG: hypothetical protein ACREI3_00870 [Nitrospirales bacterium]
MSEQHHALHVSGTGGSLEQRVFRPCGPEELAQAIEFAFDYRGDVTLTLTSGETLEGYLYNRDPKATPPVVDVFPAHQPGTRVVPYAQIVAIAFTGQDTASGKTWDAWVTKKESQRKAEAARVEAEVRARGHL